MLHFSTDTVAPAQRYSYWRDAVCSTFVPLDVQCDSRLPFHSELSVRSTAGFDLIAVRGSAQQVRRSSRMIDADGSECLIVMAQHQGEGVALQQGGSPVRLYPGSLALLDSRRPYTLEFPGGFEQTVLKLPWAQLARHAGPALARRTPALPQQSRLGALAHHAIGALASEPNPVNALTLGGVVIELLVLALGEAGDAATDPPARMQALRVAWARAHIASSLHDPALSPAGVARAQGVSLRLLQRLFARQGQQLAECIAEQRLQRCRAALQDPSRAGHSITEIALDWGFNDPGHFAKVFRRRFGCSPSQARRSA